VVCGKLQKIDGASRRKGVKLIWERKGKEFGSHGLTFGNGGDYR